MNYPSTPEPGDRGVIRITAEDLASPHVDDLLKRQASLRGEGGIAASRRRKWYYQNWFVFTIAGSLGAIAAWGLFEPSFHDFNYVQGRVERWEMYSAPRAEIDVGRGQSLELFADSHLYGELWIGGKRIYLTESTRPVAGSEPLDLDHRDEGEELGEVGVYVLPINVPPAPRVLGGESDLPSLAVFVNAQPPAGKPTTASLRDAQRRNQLMGLLLFPMVAAAVGIFIAAADGAVCRLWQRALLAGAVGLLVGLIGGLVASVLANIVYTPLTLLASRQAGAGGLGTLGFLIQVSGRGLAWGIAGMAMGLGQGIALRSSRLLLYGFLGGTLGGLLGGLLFDPIDMILLGGESPSGHVSRMVGLAAIGAAVGAMIGIVELLARDAWLHMTRGPLAGKEFLVFKDLMALGASPRSDIYLFNDDLVAAHHAVIRAAADQYEIEAADPVHPLLVNERPVQRTRLRHGDQITLGQTVFTFHRRRTE